MSITRHNPNTIFLGGDRTQVGDFALSEALTPGMGVEMFNSAGTIRWRKATAALASPHVLTNQSMLNLGVDDNYAVGDLAEVSAAHIGSTWWMLIASGQNIAAGNRLEHAGDGTLRILAAGVPEFKALENKPSVTTLTRIRVEKI
jgi:hypothetical protein